MKAKKLHKVVFLAWFWQLQVTRAFDKGKLWYVVGEETLEKNSKRANFSPSSPKIIIMIGCIYPRSLHWSIHFVNTVPVKLLRFVTLNTSSLFLPQPFSNFHLIYLTIDYRQKLSQAVKPQFSINFYVRKFGFNDRSI